MINETKDMTFIVTKWAHTELVSTFMSGCIHNDVSEVINHWKSLRIDVSDDTEDLDIQSFRYILKRVNEFKDLDDLTRFKNEVEEHYQTMPRE